MRNFLITSILAVLTATSATVRAQDWQEDYLGLPGDNLNLYAVMNLFQESPTLEEFEQKLNDESNRINNLDLNGDKYVDYITVSDYVDGDVHNIVLRVALNRYEQQDVAVITVEKLRNGSVQVQLIGDEALYGKNYIIEPIYAGTPNPGYRGNSWKNRNVTVVTTNYYQVAEWPVVRYMYAPAYVVWRSSWYWGYYPTYWTAWTPWYWHYYWGYHYAWYPDYHQHYRHCDFYRYTRYNDYYYSNVRNHSVYVSNNIHEGRYKETYSRPEQVKEGEKYFSTIHGSNTRSSRAPAYSVSGRSGDTRNYNEGNNGNRNSSSTSTTVSGNPGQRRSTSVRSDNAYDGKGNSTDKRSNSTETNNGRSNGNNGRGNGNGNGNSGNVQPNSQSHSSTGVMAPQQGNRRSGTSVNSSSGSSSGRSTGQSNSNSSSRNGSSSSAGSSSNSRSSGSNGTVSNSSSHSSGSQGSVNSSSSRSSSQGSSSSGSVNSSNSRSSKSKSESRSEIKSSTTKQEKESGSEKPTRR